MIEKKIKIIIPAFYFCNWNGGVDLIKHFLNCLHSAKKKNCNIEVLLPIHNFVSNIKYFFYPFIFFLRSFPRMNFSTEWPSYKGAIELESYIKHNFQNSIKVSYLDFRAFSSFLKKNDKAVIFPIVKYENFLNKNVAGYIFDFQHEYIKKNFSNDEIIYRRKNILQILNNFRVIFVNSKFTLSCVKKFYKKKIRNKKIFCIPFQPSLVNTYLKREDILSRYFLNSKKYFIICNQFWIHKNHYFALFAFNNYLKNGGKYKLVLTGDHSSYRSRDIYEKIQNFITKKKIINKVVITGAIEKEEQLILLKNSKSLIQPTLFEGGPGGGSSYDAIALDVPIIISDIQVNKEIIQKNIFFYDNKSYKALSSIMNKLEKRNFHQINEKLLLINSKKRATLCGNFILNKLNSLSIT
jgi:hypothetical protein